VELQQRLEGDLKDAMRAKDRVRLDAIRLLMTELKREMISGEDRRELSDDEAEQVAARVAKRHRDSIDQFEKAGRADLVEHEKAQLSIVERYLPALMTPDQIKTTVNETIEQLGEKATGPRAQGAIMAVLSPALRDKADMRLVNQIVRAELAARG
jgi:uncharacterized protein YqeY